MNILEHYIKEIHSVTDISGKFEESNGYPPAEPLYEVDLTYDCYGAVERKKRGFFKSELKKAQESGYFMA